MIRWRRLWMIVCGGFAVAVASPLMFDVPTAALLMFKHVDVPGLVTSIDANRHYATTVEYPADGAHYKREFPPSGVSTGSAVEVRFLAGHPGIALLEEPRRALIQRLAFSMVGGVWLGTGTVASWYWGNRRRLRLAERSSRRDT